MKNRNLPMRVHPITETNPTGAGCPPKPIDWNVVDQMCQLQCLIKEICAFLQVDWQTLNRRCIAEKGLKFGEYRDKVRQLGRIRLRGSQFHNAVDKHNTAMQIHLGIQPDWLDQSKDGLKPLVQEAEEEAPKGQSIYEQMFTPEAMAGIWQGVENEDNPVQQEAAPDSELVDSE